MKLYFKTYLLALAIFIKSGILHSAVESQIIYEGSSAIVSSSIEEIKRLGLLDELFNAFLNDIINVFDIIDNTKNELAKKISLNASLNEAIFDYRQALVLFNKYRDYNLVSVSTQVTILTQILYSFSVMLLQKNKMSEFLNDKNIQGLLFLVSAVGIEFSCIPVLEKIVKVITKNCASLQTSDLNNCVYEATLYDVHFQMAQALIDDNLSTIIFEKIIALQLGNLKKNINLVKSNKSNKNNKKNRSY